MRKLATLRKIAKIISHTNADNLELAIIDGWQVVVKKNEFKQNDLVVYFEIDSLLPITEEFEFLRKSSYIKKDWLKSSFRNGEAFRLRTIKLRKELSQGLIIPISDKLSVVINNGSVNIDDDLSDFFGVKKYDPPLNISNATRSLVQGKFPESIPKTDQTRIQNLSYDELLESFQLAETFEVTQKYNGSSITIYQTKNKFHILNA
jgi:RNA ligase (TIGR02306 family)